MNQSLAPRMTPFWPSNMAWSKSEFEESMPNTRTQTNMYLSLTSHTLLAQTYMCSRTSDLWCRSGCLSVNIICVLLGVGLFCDLCSLAYFAWHRCTKLLILESVLHCRRLTIICQRMQLLLKWWVFTVFCSDNFLCLGAGQRSPAAKRR